MKKFVLLAAAFALLGFADAANAADMALKAHPADPSSAYNWSGWYLGLNAGGNWGTSQTSTTIGNGTTGVFLLPVAVNGINRIGMPTDFNTRGFTGGTHGGYNYQMGHWLLGVEADFEYLRSAGSNTVTGFVVPGLPATIATSLGTDWLFTLRPRLGLIFGSWLFYGTGGLAVTRLSANWSFVSTGAAESASASATEPGWAAGGGVETMLPGKITLGVEYLHADFGSVSTHSGALFVAGVGFLTNPVKQSASLETNMVRFRLSKFF